MSHTRCPSSPLGRWSPHRRESARHGLRLFPGLVALLPVLAVLAVLGLAGPVAAGEQVPFKGRFEGLALLTPAPTTPGFARTVSVSVDATGNATHLGRFALAIPHQVDFPTGFPTNPATSSGSYQFVAANGDTLSADFIGTVTSVSGVLHAVEIATITGGTGRFADATGTFIVERVVLVDPATGIRTTIGSFEGTISSPGAAGG
jgi:hypothetical protein